jgi:hypothetical protein
MLVLLIISIPDAIIGSIFFFKSLVEGLKKYVPPKAASDAQPNPKPCHVGATLLLIPFPGSPAV